MISSEIDSLNFKQPPPLELTMGEKTLTLYIMHFKLERLLFQKCKKVTSQFFFLWEDMLKLATTIQIKTLCSSFKIQTFLVQQQYIADNKDTLQIMKHKVLKKTVSC